MNALTAKEAPDRSKINLKDEREAKGWAHKLGIGQEELRALIEKVGNSAAAVKKELAGKNAMRATQARSSSPETDGQA